MRYMFNLTSYLILIFFCVTDEKEEPRILGLAMVPGKHILSIEIDEEWPSSPPKWTHKQDIVTTYIWEPDSVFGRGFGNPPFEYNWKASFVPICLTFMLLHSLARQCTPQTACWACLLSKDCLSKLNDIPQQALS